MSFSCIKALKLALAPLALLVSAPSLAQNVIIPDESTTFPDDIIAKSTVISQCMGCHGAQGISQFPDWPNLAGLDEDYITLELQKFKEGSRKNAMMQTVMKDVSEEEITEIASYFSSLPVTITVPEHIQRPQLLQICIVCHSDGVVQNSELGPNIAGQRAGYLFKQMTDFKNQQRQNPIMNNILLSLSGDELQEVLEYYSEIKIKVNNNEGGEQ